MTFTNLPIPWLPLADAAAKVSLILAVAAAGAFALRRASAASRHLLWTLALCSALALPILTLVLPRWELPLVELARTDGPAVQLAEPAAVAPSGKVPRLEPPRPADTIAQSSSRADAVESSSSAATTSPLDGFTWPRILLAVWLLGAAMVLARTIAGLAAVSWLSRRTQEITDAPWLPMARSIAKDMGVGRGLRFLRSGRATMPVAAGLFRPSVIMPADADTWSASRLRIVLLHELAHVKRRDCLTHVVAQIACACYWFHPLAWMAAKRARAERERACDDLVLASGTRGPDYADTLLDIARVMRGDRFGLLAGATLGMAHQSQLEGRLIAILDPGLPRAGVSRARALVAVILCACAVAPLGAVQPWAAEPRSEYGSGSPVVANAVVPAEPARSHEPLPAPAAQSPAVPQPPVQPATPSVPQVPATAVEPVLSEAAEPAIELAAGAIAETLSEAVGASIAEAVGEARQTAKPSKQDAGRKVDPRTVAALTAALKDADQEVRETALHALVRLRDPAVFEPLLQALKDPSADVREQAAVGLGQMRDPRAVQPLGAALKDANASVREHAAFALGQLRDRSAVPSLAAALKDENASVREQVAFALGQLRDPAAVEALSVAVRDQNPEVRENAVFALSQIRDPKSVAPLISALKDENPDVRQQAAFALGQLRDRSAVEALVIAIKDADAEVREQVAFALGQIRDPRAIEALTTALKDASAKVRQQAAFALGQLAR